MSLGARAVFNAIGLTTNHRSVLTLYPGPANNPFVVQDNPSTHVITPTLCVDQNLDFTGITGPRYLIGQMIRQYVGCSDVPAGSPEIIGSWVIQANNIDDSGKLRMTAGQFHCEVEHPVANAVGARNSAAIGSGWAYTEANTNVVVGTFAYAGVGHQWSNCKSGTAVVAEVSNTGAAYGTADEVVNVEIRNNIRGTIDTVNGAITVGRYRGIAFTQPSQYGTEAPEFGTYIGIHFENTFDHLANNSTVEKWLIKSESVLESYFKGKFNFDNTVVAPADTGNKTIDKPSGQARIAAAGTSVVITNSQVTPDSVIIATVASNDATLKTVAVVAGTGSFTIHGNAAATAETLIKWIVFN